MKTKIGFGLFDVLIKGKMNHKPDTSFMSELVDYAKENKKELFLITGLDEEKGEKIIQEQGINSYFDSKSIHHIKEDYYSTLSDIDRELKKEAKEKDPDYADEYYKVYFFNNLFKYPKEEALFIGHDIWVDAYYLHKYSNINSILLKETLSNNHAPNITEIKDLNIIEPTFEDIKNYIINKKEFKYSSLDSYANKLLYSEIFGTSLFNSKLSVRKILDKSNAKVVLKKKEDE
ncbi:MAG: hypothetical protein WCX82_03785 [archaeon]|jgi:hypothetical protein